MRGERFDLCAYELIGLVDPQPEFKRDSLDLRHRLLRREVVVVMPTVELRIDDFELCWSSVAFPIYNLYERPSSIFKKTVIKTPTERSVFQGELTDHSPYTQRSSEG